LDAAAAGHVVLEERVALVFFLFQPVDQAVDLSLVSVDKLVHHHHHFLSLFCYFFRLWSRCLCH
jgi:hypothetical protein